MGSDGMDDFQMELVNDFLLESSEGLETFDQDLLLIEKGDYDLSLLNEVFRVVHTIKGTAGCLGFSQIESIAHTGENVLSLMRDGELESTPQIADALLKLSDALRSMLDVIESCGTDDSVGDCSDLKGVLDSIIKGESPAPVEPPPAQAAESEEVIESSDETAESDEDLESKVEPADSGWGFFDDEPEEATSEVVEPPVEETHAESSEEKIEPAEPAEPEGWGLFDDAPAASEPAPEPQKAKVAKRATPAATAKNDSVVNASVRVDVELLDGLMNMVGELVLSRNQLLQLSQQRGITPADVSGVAQRFNQVTTELQQGIMKTRMQQIGSVWGKYPRIVRDLASDLGKKVNLVTFGAETELDRTIIEAIKDPLTHIIRNAVDHGIESPDTRVAAGKADHAELIMRSFHEGGQVNIEIMDDGAGIDPDKICGKAVEKGLVSVEDASRLSDREKTNLIFLPGFSTAAKLSNVSGRGVGMDVVKTNIEKIGGSVEIHSEKGEGTTLRIKIPLTLAIVAALVVKSSNQRFAIPQVNIAELVRVKTEDLSKKIEYVYESPVYRLRGKLLPLVFLNKLLDLPSTENAGNTSVSIVVLKADGQDFGVVVDVVSDTEEIVVKPLGKQLSEMDIYAGATIMGDGSVAIILDAAGIAGKAGVLNASQNRSELMAAETEEVSRSGEKETLILFSLPAWQNLAVPLDSAERLEEFAPSSIEVSGNTEKVQYRGGIMQLLRLSALLGVSDGQETVESEQVIVYKCGERYLGIIVGENKDIVDEIIELENIGTRPYIKGSFLINGQITDLVDVDSILVQSGLKEAACHA